MKEITAEHYNLALYEYEQGMSLEELREVIKHYEDLEQFEICQGVHLAVEVIRFNILFELAEKQEIKTKKLKWKSTKKIKELVLQQTSINVDDTTRTREQVEARSLYYTLIKELTPKATLKQIGSSVNKNHATVIHGLNQWDMLVRYNPRLNKYKERILKMFDKEIDSTDIDLLRKQVNRLQGELIDLQIENERLKNQLLNDAEPVIKSIKELLHKFAGTEQHELFLFRLNQLVEINSKRKI